jgi:hypothetical protein
MIIIRQHGPNGELRDFNRFCVDMVELREIEQWKVCIEECLGEGSDEIDRLCSAAPVVFEADQFRALYAGIYQTIDGSFVGLVGGRECCRLEAIDSTTWDISGTLELESKAMVMYGGDLSSTEEYSPY